VLWFSADPFHSAKEVGMGRPVSRHGALQNTDLLFVTPDVLERHGILPPDE